MITFVMYLATAVMYAAMLIFTSQLMPNNLNTWKITGLSLGIAIFAPIKMQFAVGTPIFIFIGIIAYPIVFCLPLFFYKGKIWKRYAIYIFFNILMMYSDIIGASLLSVIYGDINVFYTETTPMLIYSGVTLTLHILFGSLAVIAWRMIVARKFQPFYFLFFILPIGQLVTVYSFVFTSLTLFWILGILISMIASLVLLVYTISQEKKTALEEELRETRHAMDLEQYHYREVELRRDELAKIRHDFNNQLASVSQLIRVGNESSAQDVIKALSEEIAGTREDTYCSIPIVNAIITEKARDCAAAGISLEVDLDFPASLSVEHIHLCSIFGNLLDNAVNACKQLQNAGKPTIELKSVVDGGYLFIKLSNPSPKPTKKPMHGRGYGSRILSDYAARYCGDYRAEYQDGAFSAMVSLLVIGGVQPIKS